MDKQTFDEIVAGIWQVYSASTALSSTAILTRAQAEATAELITQCCSNLTSKLVCDIAQKQAAQPKPVKAA